MKSRKAQSAALLIGVISALIVIYIIFLPSEDRLDMIGENESERAVSDDEMILLQAEEIIMEHIGRDEIEHDLPSVNLYTSTSAHILTEENTIYVKRGMFDKAGYEKEFKITDMENTENVLISFSVMKSKGRLAIIINEHEIFNNEIDQVNIEPLKISKDLLSETNTIRLEVSGVGIAFWRTNEFLLSSFKLTADVTDISTQEAVLKFMVGTEEAGNVEKATLRFVPECQPQNVGMLQILLNNNEIFSSIPDCGVARPLQFSPILYYFDIDGDDMRDIERGNKLVNLTFFFTDDRKTKEAEIVINGKKTYMTRHEEVDWSANLDRYVESGSNSLKIIPEERLEIRRMLVQLGEE
jgi:hypothetical protein